MQSKNIISIIGAQPVQIYSGCNYFVHLNKLLFFIIAFPSSKKRMFKYIFISLIYLFFAQILRIASFAIFLKYLPNHWDAFHDNSSYLFYYPGIIVLWYFYSLNTDDLKS